MRNAAIATMLVMLLVSCTGADSGRSLPVTNGSAPEAARGQDDVSRIVDGFSLTRLEDGLPASPGISLDLEQHDLPGGTRIDVMASASAGLRGLMLELSYDQTKWSPVDARAGGLLADADAQLLQLADIAEPGQARLGQVLANWDSREGVSGSGLVASFSFSSAPFVAPRQSSQVADADSARARLVFNQYAGIQRINWHYSNPGDYNQDGLVAISDLTPLGQNFGESGPFAYDTSEAVIDGDGNGEINLADLTTIGRNLGNEVTQYAVYWSSRPDLDIPVDNTEDTDHTPSAVLDHPSWFTGQGRMSFYWDVDLGIPLPYDGVLWVRPLDGAGNPGTPSNHTGEDNGDPAGQAPVMFLEADTVSGNVPLTVTFDASRSFDPRGGQLIADFRVENEPAVTYYESGSAGQTYELTITEPGSYLADVSSGEGFYRATSLPIHINAMDSGNSAPIARLDLTSMFQIVRTDSTIVVDMSASTDPDGDPLMYEFDLSSDTLAFPIPRGDFEVDNAGNPVHEFMLGKLGNYRLDARVSDGRGLSDIASISLEAWDADTQDYVPDVDIRLSAYSGEAPLQVEFLQDYITDQGGSIVRVDVDPLGNHNWQEHDWLAGNFIHTYTTAGDFSPRMRALDDTGNYGYSSADLLVQVSSQPGIPPTAHLTALQTEGFNQLTANLDARGSFDQFGRIVKYEFDPGDGSGWVDDSGNDGWHPYTYLIGTYEARVRVTDDEGLTDEASLAITVNSF